MNIKLDENMPADLVEMLDALGHSTDTVPQESLTRRSDSVVRRAARAEERFLITKDKKFVDERIWKADPGTGVMLVRIPEATRQMLIDAVYGAFLRSSVDEWVGKIVVVTRNKVRVRPLKGKDSK